MDLRHGFVAEDARCGCRRCASNVSFAAPRGPKLGRQGHIRVMLDNRTQRDTHILFGGPVIGACLSASPRFIERHAVELQGVANAVTRAMVWLRTAVPVDMIRHLPMSHRPSDVRLFFDVWVRAKESLASDGRIPDGAALTMLRALGRLPSAVNWHQVQVGQTVNNRYAQRARHLWRA